MVRWGFCGNVAYGDELPQPFQYVPVIAAIKKRLELCERNGAG